MVDEMIKWTGNIIVAMRSMLPPPWKLTDIFSMGWLIRIAILIGHFFLGSCCCLQFSNDALSNSI